MRYGDDETIHGTEHVDVETDAQGNVVSVWYRCMMLPFKQARVDESRAADMREAYREDGAPALVAVNVDPGRRLKGGQDES